MLYLFFIALSSLVALIALAGLFQFWASRRDARAYPPPGRMIDIGGRRLHARVEGEGSPAVIFEAGISASSINWVVTQPRVAAFTTTCSYDRAGLAWSDPPGDKAPLKFDAARMVDDLSALLATLKLPEPYVLVGHSFGGTLVRIFADRYPEKIAGLILIDPVLACCWAHPDPENARQKNRGALVARWGARFAAFGAMRLATWPPVVSRFVVPKFGRKANEETEEGVIDRLQTELVKLPLDLIPIIRAHWCRPKNFRAMTAHLAALEPSFELLSNVPVDYPLIVISAANTSPEGVAEHRAVAALSSRGEHIIARASGHWVQFDEPDLVIDAIRRLCAEAHRRTHVKS